MNNVIGHRFTRKMAVLLSVCACSAGAVVATATGTVGKPANRFAGLSAHGAPASAIARLGVAGAQSTLLSSNAAGKIEATQQADGDICIADQVAGLTATGCGHQAAVEALGLSMTIPASASQGSGPEIISLVPDGVTSVTYETSDGTATTVAVSNNFARFSSPGLASAHYTLPNGAASSISIDSSPSR